eukprot:1630254-Pyramimonas_sp.AAC.1
MLALSTSRRLLRMLRPGRKPCCRGRIHFAWCSSHRLRAALATRRLSALTMFRGRVLARV